MKQTLIQKIRELDRFIVILYICLALADQLFIDQTNLPIGFESAKVLLIRVLAGFALIYLYISANILVFKNQGKIFQRLKLIVKKYWAIILFLVFLIISLIISTLGSSYPYNAIWGSEFRFTGLVTYLSLIIIFCFVLVVFRSKYLPFILNIFLTILFIQTILAIQQASQLPWSVISQGYYVNGNFGQSNFFGGTIVAGLGIIGFRLLFTNILKNKIQLIIQLGLGLLFLIVLILSFSNGAWLVASGLIIFLMIFKIITILNKNNLLSNKMLFLSSIIAILIFMIIEIWIIHTYEPGRRTIWDAVIKLIPEKPIFGFGPDNLGLEISRQGLLVGRNVDRAHSLYLDLIYNFGVFQLVIWIGLAINLGKNIWNFLALNIKKNSKLFEVLIIIGVFLVSGIFQEKSIYHSLEFMVFLAILIKLLGTGSSQYK